jgi:zinc D-Ala-D-Ala carboxypeptidase
MKNFFFTALFLSCIYCFLPDKKTSQPVDNQLVARDTVAEIPIPEVKQIELTPINNAAEKPVKNALSVDYLMGKFDPDTHTDFIEIDKKYAVREDMFLRKEAYEAYKKMYAAAEKEGVKLTVVSATRNFKNQKNIWETKWQNLIIKDPTERALKILEFSSMPGSSRHHWGTDIDIVNLSNAYFDKNGGKKIYAWLLKHAAKYGFCQPYTAGRPSGYHEEKWHWTYMPLSKDFTKYAENNLKNEMIKGFIGSETAVSIDIVKNYVLGINKNCF